MSFNLPRESSVSESTSYERYAHPSHNHHNCHRHSGTMGEILRNSHDLKKRQTEYIFSSKSL